MVYIYIYIYIDFFELIGLLSVDEFRIGNKYSLSNPPEKPLDAPGTLLLADCMEFRPRKIRGMLASRACRSSVMVGTELDMRQMMEIVQRMAALKNPWNCPHGRPTIRLLFDY